MAALVVALVPPVTYGALGWLRQDGQARLYAEHLAQAMAQVAVRQPVLWRYNAPKIVQAAGGVRGVFHCFSGSAEQAARAVALGFLLGIGGVATFKNGGLDRVLPGVALEHLVLETDAPYLAPVPHRGKRNEPAHVALVAERLASWYGTTAHAVGKATSANAARLFGW